MALDKAAVDLDLVRAKLEVWDLEVMGDDELREMLRKPVTELDWGKMVSKGEERLLCPHDL